ncbi:U3 small nucleolar RNA-associated protein 11 [Astathelohania contejeani]|uniref:U3 small nucleolar RNA-associated protein 11 n=1 Tax=Astathelohania contejeani TaxID=164912 RepID=A0ABQ7I1Q1_9MICR|nr:U3 small nucleolar RNA-associated protein 11 [Thelohania contejeani]
MGRKNYKERTQLPEREELGPLDKPKDTQKRLKKLEKKASMIKSAREIIIDRKGDEYLYRMHSCRLEDGEIICNPNIDQNKLKKDIRYLDFEINRVENKIKRYLAKPEGEHIRFDEGNEIKKEGACLNYENPDLKKFQDYVEKLKSIKKAITK